MAQGEEKTVPLQSLHSACAGQWPTTPLFPSTSFRAGLLQEAPQTAENLRAPGLRSARPAERVCGAGSVSAQSPDLLLLLNWVIELLTTRHEGSL